MNALLLRHERSHLPLGEFLVTEGVITQKTLDDVLKLQEKLQLSMPELLKSAGLSDEQLAEINQGHEPA